jgi:hypothetical protein
MNPTAGPRGRTCWRLVLLAVLAVLAVLADLATLTPQNLRQKNKSEEVSVEVCLDVCTKSHLATETT